MRHLSHSERIRCRGFADPSDRSLYGVAHAGLRLVLARYLDADPARLCFGKTGNGKPALSGLHGYAGLCFNLSHSGERVAVAVARHTPVGVDVERMRGSPRHVAMAQRFFAAEEYDFLIRQPVEDQPDTFYRIWTLKEAFLKLTGTGFARRLDSFAILPGSPPILLRADATTRNRSWSIDCRYLPGGYICAVMAGRSGARIRHFGI